MLSSNHVHINYARESNQLKLRRPPITLNPRPHRTTLLTV